MLVSWNNSPDVEEVNDLFVPEEDCEYCEHYKKCKCELNADLDCVDDHCEQYEWNGEFLEEPRCPYRGDYKNEKDYRADRKFYLEWHAQQEHEYNVRIYGKNYWREDEE